jgi:hypothetical protein
MTQAPRKKGLHVEVQIGIEYICASLFMHLGVFSR